MKFKSNIEAQSNIILDGALTDAGGSPGNVNQLLSSTVTGTAWIDPSTIVAEAATLVVIACKNTSGAAIAQGTPVYQTGTVGATATIEIAPADALISANKLPAIGLLQTALNNNGFGFVVITGELTNFTTSPIDGVVPTTGDKIFVKSGGGLTLTKPTGEGNGIQNMGLVGKVSGGNSGSITVSSIMRTNDVPNLPEGRIWIGDGNTIVSDTVYVDEPNNSLIVNGTTLQTTESLSVIGSGYFSDKISIGTAASTVPGDNSYTMNLLDLNSAIAFGDNSQTTRNVIVGEYGSTDTDQLWLHGKKGTIFTHNSTPSIAGVIDILGNFGLGTTAPASKLQVEDDSPTLILNHNGQASASQCEISARVSGYATPPIGTLNWNTGFAGENSIWSYYNQSTSTNNFLKLDRFDGFIVSLSGFEKMRVNQAGNVGINTTNPTSKLTSFTAISGPITTENLAAVLGVNTSTDTIYANSIGVMGKVSTSNGKAIYGKAITNSGWGGYFDGKGYFSSNVGIGTTSPGEKLTINGNDKYVAAEHSSYKWGASNVIGGKLGVTSANGAAILDMRRWTGSGNNHGTAAITQTNINGAWGLDFKVGAKTTNTVSTVSRMFIDQDGRVGIGTTNPGSKLHVSSGGGANGDCVLLIEADVDNTVETSNPVLRLSQDGGSVTGALSLTANNEMTLYNEFAGKLFLGVGNSPKMTIQTNGNVGIGTTSPSYKLYVSGNGRFTSTVTATNFILSSDKRLKNNIKEVSSNHVDVNWKTFEMNSDKGQSRYGVIAQELEEKHPEFVRTDDEGIKSVAYIDLLIAKIAELEARLEKLEK